MLWSQPRLKLLGESMLRGDKSITIISLLTLITHPHAISNLFQAERYVSILTVGAMAAAAVHPTLAVDHALAILVPLHTHWGLEQVKLFEFVKFFQRFFYCQGRC